jgi:hypothetical protein
MGGGGWYDRPFSALSNSGLGSTLVQETQNRKDPLIVLVIDDKYFELTDRLAHSATRCSCIHGSVVLCHPRWDYENFPAVLLSTKCFDGVSIQLQWHSST